MTWTLEDIQNDENIIKNIRWDLTPEKVFAPRTVQTQDDIERLYNDQKDQAGYYFYIDVWNCRASLALMHLKPDGSAASEIMSGFPEKTLIEAVEEAGGAINISGHYPINAQVKKLIRFVLPALKV